MKIDGYRENRRKNHWRRWQWNRITERIEQNNKKTKDAVVLYLAGKDNADLLEAERRGFDKRNMIAVDLDDKVINHLRRDGITCFKSKLSDAIFAWKGDPKIDVIIADFCSGIMQEQFLFAYSLLLSSGLYHRKTVVSVNLQRGRDKCFSDTYRVWRDQLCVDVTKHRGVGFINLLFDIFLKISKEKHTVEKYIETNNMFKRWVNPVFNEYKSGKQLTFDSCVFSACNLVDSGRVKNVVNYQMLSNTIRLISAAKAIRTSIKQ